MNTCKGIIQEGKNKGTKCDRPITNGDNYCKRHLRNKIYDEGIENGIRWCRFFFRGCNNEITSEPSNVMTCTECLNKNKIDFKKCQNENCKSKAKDNDIFCGKHERDKYKLEEIEKGIKYCDIYRGCFNICENGKKSCENCLKKAREKDNERLRKRKELNEQLKNTSDKRICQNCGRDFDVFKTSHNIDSTKCKKCFESQQKIEENRMDRSRNYKEEKKKSIEIYFKTFIKESDKRGYNVDLTFDEYYNLVLKECYYCGYYNNKEAIGIDRINNSIHYTKENCVSCCETCNRIKHIYHPLFFIDKAKIISKLKEPSTEFYKEWDIYYTRSKHNQYSKYKKETEEKRDIKFLITEVEWDRLIRQPCYLCEYIQVEGLGIDRVDNTIREYNLTNCKPCCGSCNNMKHDMNYDDFINHMKKISDKWSDTTEIESISKFNNPFRRTFEENNDTKERVRWTSNGLYYAFLSNLEDDFITFYKEHIKDDEVHLLKNEIFQLTDKEEILNKISTYLNTLNVRRKRAKRAKQ
jgi:hypothetical protein